MTTILFGLSYLPAPWSKGFVGYGGVAGTELVLGGLILIIAGIIALSQNYTFWGTAFLGWGAFWGAWALVGSGAHAYGAAGLAFVWMLFTLTFLVSSFKHGWVTFLLFLVLMVGFILLVVEFWQGGAGNSISNGEMWAVGGIWIVAGLIGWYRGTAELTNHTYGKKRLPT